jgi:hypothetical protein
VFSLSAGLIGCRDFRSADSIKHRSFLVFGRGSGSFSKGFASIGGSSSGSSGSFFSLSLSFGRGRF